MSVVAETSSDDFPPESDRRPGRYRRSIRQARRACSLALVFSAQITFAQEITASMPSGFEAAIQSTLENHPALEGQNAEIDAKDYAIAEARALRLPSLNGQVGQSFNDEGLLDSTLVLRQPLWTFGRITSEYDYARIDRGTQLAERLALYPDLMERTGIAYARVLGASNRLTVSDSDIRTLTALVSQIRRRADARIASPADVALAESRLIQMRATRKQLVAEQALAQTDLLALTQEPVRADTPIAGRYTRLAPLSQLELAAMKTSASVLRSEYQVALARADTARERTRAFPTIYLEGQAFSRNDRDDEDMTIGLVIEGSIDGLGIVQLNKARARAANARAAEATLAVTRTDLERRIRTLHNSRDSNRSLIQGYKSSIDQLESVLASYQRQYEAGRKGWLELLNLYREVAELRLQLEQAQTDWTIDSISLSTATGQLDAVLLPGQTP